MKHIKNSVFLLILSLTLLTSCKKEEFPIFPVAPNSPPATNDTTFHIPNWIYVNAVNWTSMGASDYVCIFVGINHSGYIHEINEVYLATEDDDRMISKGAIRFMNGELWSVEEGSDLKIYFKPMQGNLPFSSIRLRIVF